MRRREICEIVHISEAMLKKHRILGNLPFRAHKPELVAGNRTWTRYSIHHAAMLLAATDLSQMGLGWPDACTMLRGGLLPDGTMDKAYGRHVSNWVAGPSGPGHHPIEVEGIHVSRIRFQADEPSRSTFASEYRVYRGPIAQILMSARDSAEAHNTKHARIAADRVRIAGFISTDLSRAYRIAADRMRTLGITNEYDDGAVEE